MLTAVVFVALLTALSLAAVRPVHHDAAHAEGDDNSWY